LLWKRARMKIRHLARLNRISPVDVTYRILLIAQDEIKQRKQASPQLYSYNAASPILTKASPSISFDAATSRALDVFSLDRPPNIPRTPTASVPLKRQSSS
jgi:hypothetical protein